MIEKHAVADGDRHSTHQPHGVLSCWWSATCPASLRRLYALQRLAMHTCQGTWNGCVPSHTAGWTASQAHSPQRSLAVTVMPCPTGGPTLARAALCRHRHACPALKAGLSWAPPSTLCRCNCRSTAALQAAWCESTRQPFVCPALPCSLQGCPLCSCWLVLSSPRSQRQLAFRPLGETTHKVVASHWASFTVLPPRSMSN